MDKFLKRKVEDKPSNDNNENNNNVKESKTEKEDQPAKKQKNSETKEEDDETPIEKSLTLPLADLKDADSFDAEFQKIAQFLLNEVTLMINGKPHRISEIEFYFTSKTHHDPFTHCEADQETCANFYFHKTNGSYRGGTYKGMDVTIGQGDKDVGGILIRSIEALDGSKFVCGPCLCVNHILELNKAGDNVGGFVSKHLKDDISVEKKDGSVLYLKRSKSMPQKKIYRSPRVGLHMTKKGEDKELQKKFVFKNYRFFTDPDKIKKGNSLMIAAMHHAGLTNQQIATILKARPPTVEKWVDLFEEGKKKGEADSYFGKKLSDDDIAKAIGALNQHL